MAKEQKIFKFFGEKVSMEGLNKQNVAFQLEFLKSEADITLLLWQILFLGSKSR